MGLPSRFWEYVSRSTLKREAASAIMIWYLAMGTWLMMYKMPIEQAIIAWTGMQLAVFGVFTAAFGSDFVAKQTNWGGPPSGPENEHPTLKVEVPPQPVKVEGIVEGTINIEEEKKANG